MLSFSLRCNQVTAFHRGRNLRSTCSSSEPAARAYRLAPSPTPATRSIRTKSGDAGATRPRR